MNHAKSTATGAADTQSLPPLAYLGNGEYGFPQPPQPEPIPALTHAGSGCVIQIEVVAHGQYTYRCELDGKSIGYRGAKGKPAVFASVKAALSDATDFIADCFNLFGEVVIKTRPRLTVVTGGAMAEAA